MALHVGNILEIMRYQENPAHLKASQGTQPALPGVVHAQGSTQSQISQKGPEGQ